MTTEPERPDLEGWGPVDPYPAAQTTPVPPPNERRSYNWDPVRRAYTEGQMSDGELHWPSLSQLGEQFDIPAVRVREKSSQEGWVEKRRNFQAQVESTRRRQKAASMAKKATELDSSAVDAAQMGLQLSLAALASIGERAQKRRTEQVGTGGGDSGIDALELQRLAAAVEMWHKVGLRAVGDPETQRLEITGAGGGPIEIAAELRRDDPDRLASVLSVLAIAGLRDVIPGEVVHEAAAELDRNRGGDGVSFAVEARR